MVVEIEQYMLWIPCMTWAFLKACAILSMSHNSDHAQHYEAGNENSYQFNYYQNIKHNENLWNMWNDVFKHASFIT